jgi:hypothetical protein
VKWVYHAGRLVFGAWWLFSGLMHFVTPDWQPLGDEPASRAFTEALIASGLFTWVKVIEVILGLTMLLNRAMPLTIIALAPLNVVIVYWNFVLDEGAVEWTFGALSIAFNAILAWPWRHYFGPLVVWKGAPDYGLAAGWPPARDQG